MGLSLYRQFLFAKAGPLGAEVDVKYDPNDHTRVALDIYEPRK